MRFATGWLPVASLLLTLALSASGPGRLRAQDGPDDEAREKKARKLLDLAGQDAVAKQQLAMMEEQFSRNPQLPPGFAKKFHEIVKPGELVEVLVPIYAKHFDDDELDELMEFYRTRVGRKLAKSQAQMTREAQKAGEKWGFQVGLRVTQALQQERFGTPGDDEDEHEAPRKKPEKKKPEKPAPDKGEDF